MTSENCLGRVAGLLYLIVVLTGIFSLVYVPSRISVSGDAQATLANIVASESLYRSGVAGFLVNQAAFLLLPLVLFRMLRTVHPDAAILMVALAVVSVPVALLSLANRLDALSLLTDAYYASSYSPEHLQAAAMRSLDAYGNGLLVAKLFWGLWLLPFGYLVLRSGFLPKILGMLLMLGCLGYLVDVFGELLFPGYAGTFVADYARLPAAAGEIGTCLWLLLVGARPPRSAPA